MSIAAHIQATYALPDYVVRSYIEDLTDAELLVRPHEAANHLAWQLGHLIAGENFHINGVFPDSMPKLPDGFTEQHSAETAGSDSPADFLTKAEYLSLMDEQRAGALAILEKLSDEELSQPAPESLSYLGATVGTVFSGTPAHWLMHAGQWAIIRRKLGKPPLF